MKKLFFVFIFLAVLLVPVFSARADEVGDKTKEIEELEKKVAELKGQVQTLSGQIAYYDGQIKLNQLKISQTEDLIASISGKIISLEKSLERRADLLEKQIVVTYKHSRQDPVQLFLSNSNFSQVLAKFKYTQVIQQTSRQLMHDTQVVQSNYSDQKTLIEDSKKRLVVQRKNLEDLKTEKNNLLTVTKNNEATYQKLLEQARLELQSITNALAAGKKEGPVKKGDPIALMGNSGAPSCSTGAHLHFEVRQNDQWVNAETYLRGMTDKWGLNIGSGSWDWPMKGSIEITQRYGKTPYSAIYRYSGGIHTGVDMVSSDKVVYAVADGTLYSYTGKCGSSNLNIKFIDHGNGIKTLYLHVQ
jgi:septal ring factor EnvC (AmiA/AmiB activator)